MRLAGANPNPRIAGVDQTIARSNCFTGRDPKKWRTNVPTYARVAYESIYPGIDAVFYGAGRQFECDFIVAPGADPKSITLAFNGGQGVGVDRGGDLVVDTPAGEVRLRRPVAYQQGDGRRRDVSINYVVDHGGRVSFHVAGYDTAEALVIDPVLVYSTTIGGSGNDRASSIAADSTGNVYITGTTLSTDFPTAAQA